MMTTPTEEFISSFHSLSGVTIGERQKNLFLLLDETRSRNKVLDFSSCHPKTPLEETFKVYALIYWGRSPELLKVLESENPILIKKVLKHSRLFLDLALQTLNGEQLVTSVFPYVSYNVKVKIVNKMSVCLSNSQQAESFFEAIRKKYGLYLALKLLPSCSKDLILQNVEKSAQKLTSRQLLNIIKKWPDLTETIFSALSANMTEDEIGILHHNIFVYLAKTNNPVFLKLYDKYKPSIRLGRRATHKFICANRQAVIHNANSLHKLLHKKQTYKTLRESFNDYYHNLFPTSINAFSNLYSFLFSFFKSLPSDAHKLTLLEENFRKRYGTELWEHPSCLTVALLDMAPLEKRLSVKSKPFYISDDRWTCYLGTDESIPLLKKRISLSSDISKRTDLIACLVETCKINKDTNALLDVCKYVIAQHRNDHVSVRHRFLVVLKNSFELQKLKEEHWLCINELIEIFNMNAEVFNLSNDFLLMYIHHRLLKGLPIEQYFTEYLKAPYIRWNVFTKNPTFEKRCLILTGELLPQIFHKDTLKYNQLKFLEALIDWNRRHPIDQFSIFNYPSTIDFFRQTLIEQKNTSQSVIKYCLQLKPDGMVADDLISLCLENLTSHLVSTQILSWLLKYKTVSVFNNIEIVIKLVLRHSNRAFWRHFRNYTHLPVAAKISSMCLEALDSLAYTKKRNTIIGLSYLMNPKEFLKLSSKYNPTELKADACNEESREKYKHQTAIASCLKNVIPASLTLDSILNFCKGDYLKLIQSSLYSVSGNINEHKLALFFSQLAQSAVSIRKHAFHLTLRTLDREAIFSMLGKFMETERNASMRKFLFKGSFKLFLQDPDDNLWKLVKTNVEAVDKDDKEVVEILIQVDKIPTEYIAEYILFVWTHLTKLLDKKHKFELLHSLSTPVIKMLPVDFCYGIIDDYLLMFSNPTESQWSIYILHEFVCKFIIYCTGTSRTLQQECMDLVLTRFKDFMRDSISRRMVDDFLKTFCLEFLLQRCKSKSVLELFADIWKMHIEPNEALPQYLYLQLSLICVDYLNQSIWLYQVGEKFAELCNSVSDEYGAAVVIVLCDVLNSFIRHVYLGVEETCHNNRYVIIEAMIKTSSSSACLISAISLLKTNIRDDAEIQHKHTEIVGMLRNLSDPLVQVCLDHHLHRMNI